MRLISPNEENALKEQFFDRGTAGYFVEVGAGDPYFESQTWQFEQAGWTGILIEPRKDLAEKLRKERTAVVFNVACSSPKNAGRLMPFYVAGSNSSLERERLAAGTAVQCVVEVPTRTLDQILTEARVTPPIDFISIDVEGHELGVLQGFDFRKWCPRLILVEDHVGDLSIPRFMKSVGYRLIRHTHYNGWYVPDDSAVRVPWKDRLGILRKYYLALPFRKLRNASRERRRRSVVGLAV